MRRLAGFMILACLVATPAGAQQVFESVGSRALGMGGAFVAVADDGTATFWNPAGVALVPKGNFTVEWAGFQSGNRDVPPVAGPTKRTAEFASLGGGDFAVSYGTLQGADLTQTATGLRAETLKVTQYGATVLQALAPGVIVGSTLKLLRGFAASQVPVGATGSNALSQVFSASGSTVTKFDFDVGLMVVVDKVRFGLSAKNLEEPAFPDAAGTGFTLRRQVRGGVSLEPGAGLTLAMDVDLDTVDLRGGLRRMIALGGEDRFGRRFALRGGVRWSIAGDRQLVGSFGVSLALRPGAWIDGHYTRGDLDGDRGFGIAFRAGS
jgi:hypothetical protein